jgi:phytoene dehydrogenase-like protein
MWWIGAGLGGLTAAARVGRKVLVRERNASVGGAASTYKVGDLVAEGALHETADPRDPFDPKHHILARIGALDEIEWVPVGSFYELRGGPVDSPFLLPDNFTAADEALNRRFPAASAGIARVLGDMQRIAASVGRLSRGRAALRDARAVLKALGGLPRMVHDWRCSLSETFARAFADNEAVKCALAANLAITTTIRIHCGGSSSPSRKAISCKAAAASSVAARGG